MKTCCRCKQLFSLDSFHKDKTKPDGHSYSCKRCKLTSLKAAYDADPIAAAQKSKAKRDSETPIQREDRLTKANVRMSKYYYDNHEQQLLKQATYRETRREVHKEYVKEHYQLNRADYIRRARERREHLTEEATPSWANKAAMDTFWDHATLMTDLTGVPYEVDHIIPINNPVVCGFNCEQNLRVVTATVNRSKSNKFVLEY